MKTPLSGLEKLISVVAAIRHPQTGCPWDLEQDHASLMKYFFEELHEFNEALTQFGAQDARTVEELSDCLLQIALHSKLLEEKGIASLDQIAQIQADKLISRHPHVFDPHFERFKTGEEVNKNWEKIKAWAKAEKSRKAQGMDQKAFQKDALTLSPKTPTDGPSSFIDVPKGLSALNRSARLGEKAATLGFDWANSSQVLDKIREEISELSEASSNESHAQEELGDLFFACAQYARKRKWDPEAILEKANRKFHARFEKLNTHLQSLGLNMETLSIDELEEHWQKIKLL